MTNDKLDTADALLKRKAEQSALAHGGMRTYFEHIERALSKGDLCKGAELLEALTDQVRIHLMNEEKAARSAGLPPMQLRHLQHETLIERARLLRTKCLLSPSNRELCRRIEAEMVEFLSDLVEDELVTENSIHSVLRTAANDG